MRSSVSYMLSHGSGEPIMSHPDYEQQAIHHGCLLVLVRGIGPSKPRSLQKIFERVQKINNVKITDSAGVLRDIWVRYVHDHPAENNDWGDFQTHRRLLGLITIGKFDTQTDLNELCRLHESLKVKYINTLYDSRCILFGPSINSITSATTTTATVNTNSTSETTIKNDNNIITNNIVNNLNSEIAENSIDEKLSDKTTKTSTEITKIMNHPLKRLEDEFIPPTNFKSTAFFYPENDLCLNLDGHIKDFICSLFWILESKRLERSREKIDKISLLLAPFEKKDFIGLDLESRNNKKRCLGRITKNLGDLTLQAGLISDAINLFHAAGETLRAISDSLWLGAADEGLCAASIILLYPHLRYQQQQQDYHRNASLPQDGISPQKSAIAAAAAEKRRSSDLTSKKTIPIIDRQNSNDGNGAGGGGGGSSSSSNSSSTSSVSSILTTGSDGSSSSSSKTITATTPTKNQRTELPANILTPDEIVTQYRKAIINYSKYRHAAIIETEATLKAARICIEQNKNLDVAMFLQNVLYINLNMTDQERVKRFEVLTDLYQRIGYHRKAAFCQRLAAWKHVIKGNPQPDWLQSYRLMLDSFPGYMLSLDPLEVLENASGWPMLQIDLLQQLITAARRLGHSALATRHMTYLLQTQWNNMSPNEQREMALQLQNLSAQCEGSPVPLVLENGTVIPPANLTDIPYCIQMQIKDLPSHLKPHRIKIIKEDSGPFLFTPIHINSIDRRLNKKKENKIAFQWVQHDLSEITLKLKNTLPFELTVNDMRLLTNGIVFESLPQTIVLQPSTPTLVTLHGTPIECGQLEILGYSTHTLGVKSNCRLKHMRNRSFPSNYQIDVIPALPRLTAKTSFPQTATFSSLANSESVITSASLTLYNGESTECIITIKNESNIQIDHLDAMMQSNIDNELQKKIFQIDYEEIDSKLPIPPGVEINFTLKIFGEADFLTINNPVVFLTGGGSSSSGAGVVGSSGGIGHNDSGAGGGGPQSLNYSSMLSSGHASLPSRVSSPTPPGGSGHHHHLHNHHSRRSDLTSSFRSSHSAGGQSSLATLSYFAPPSIGGAGVGSVGGGVDAIRQIDAQLRLKYSGGDAMQQGYCRQCAISFSLEMLPSALITSWDVLPAEIPSQFYLVLDVTNLTAQEMSLNYTQNKSILIEAKENCRVPIPVDRCSLEKLYNSRDDAMTAINDGCDGIKITTEPNRDEIFNKQTFNEMCEKTCSEHIAEQVKLNWTLTGTETKGIASLKGICLSPAMMDVITIAPLQWSITFDNTLVQPQSEITCSAGQCISLNISICNLSQSPLRHLILTIQFYQDYQNGVHNYNLETRVTMSGPNQKLISCLQKNEKIHHDCSVIFFTPGRFKANIQCRSMASSTAASVPSTTTVSSTTGNINQVNPLTNALSSSSPLQQKLTGGTTQIFQQTDPHPVAFNMYTFTSDTSTSFHEIQHVWRFIPPLEITVIEQ